MLEYFRNIHRAVKSIFTGMAVTLRYMSKQVVTIQYPDEMVPVAPRYRGFHEYEIERCIACSSCVRACPVDCIALEADGKGKTAVVKRYQIDYGRCLFCALCVEACPTNCLHMGKIHDLSGYSRQEVMVEFAELARQGRRTPEPVWLARARQKGAKAPRWQQVLADHYKPQAPISWGQVGSIDVKAKPPKSLSWADRG
jgi:NADH-quinone oxidoreductase subunit I